nr:hypothetical protein KPHV_86230 [Kitasatospora purpeofusca]
MTARPIRIALARDGAPVLGERENEVLRLIARGVVDAAIGRATGAGVADIQQTLNRMGARTRAQAAAWAASYGIVTAPLRPSRAVQRPPRLSPRQLQVVRCWVGGLTAAEAATWMGVPLSTFRGYERSVRSVLYAYTPEQGAVVAVLGGIAPLSWIDHPPVPAVGLGLAA